MLESLLDSLSTYAFWKDKNSIYLGCNCRYAIANQLHHPSEIIGKTDFDFYPHHLALKYRNDDQHVIQSRQPLIGFVESGEFNDGSKIQVKTTKIPLFNCLDPQEVIGVLGVYLPTPEFAATYEQKIIHRLQALADKASQLPVS